MKKIILIFILITSCSILEEPTQAYYNFKNNDFNKLLNLELNSVITYKNQFDDKIIFEVNETSDQYINQISRGSWVTSTTNKYFFYDQKEIELANNSNDYSLDYRFQRFPINFEQAKEDDYTEYPSEFNGSISISSWNGIGDYGILNIDYEREKLSMLINEINYENVMIFQSNNPETSLSNDINVVYYYVFHGVVGFDDLNNNKWRIIN